MNRCSRGTTVLERESARYRSSEQRYRYNKIHVKDYGEYLVQWIKMYNKICVKNYGEYVVQWVQMLIMGEDDIFEGLLLSWDRREKKSIKIIIGIIQYSETDDNDDIYDNNNQFIIQ